MATVPTNILGLLGQSPKIERFFLIIQLKASKF